MSRGFGTRSSWMIVFCLLLLGTVLVFVRFDLGSAFSLLLRGQRATGEAELVDDAQWVVKFRTADGSIVRRRFDAVTRAPAKSPEVLYDPVRPMRCIMRGERNVPMVLFGFLLLGACVCLARGLRQYVLLARGRS